MTAVESPVVTPRRYATDAALLADVLRVYKSHCRYLTSAAVGVDGTGALGAACEFAIPESCYIDDTGHFNSVEFNICYNQMFYYVVAKAIKERLLPAFGDWTLDDYWRRQLQGFAIATFESVFRAPMRGRLFRGEIAFRKVRQRMDLAGRQPLVWFETTCRYWEDGGGSCDGEVRVVAKNGEPA